MAVLVKAHAPTPNDSSTAVPQWSLYEGGVPGQHTGIIAGTGTIPHTATVVELIRAKRFHSRYVGHRGFRGDYTHF